MQPIRPSLSCDWIFGGTEHCSLWCCNHTSRFPRIHRFVLGERIERNLYDLNSYVSYLRAKTKNYTVFDRRFISKLGSRRKNWKYSAKGRDKTWVVSVSYVGPPTSIREPPIYQIDLDATGAFKDIYIIAPGAEL